VEVVGKSVLLVRKFIDQGSESINCQFKPAKQRRNIAPGGANGTRGYVARTFRKAA